MIRHCVLALVVGLFALCATLRAEDKPKPTNEANTQPKPELKKDDPPVKVKGVLPNNWKKLGLTDKQVQDIYKIQGKYGDEIDKLEAKIAELKTTRDKEMKAILTEDQKKRLNDILTGKDK